MAEKLAELVKESENDEIKFRHQVALESQSLGLRGALSSIGATISSWIVHNGFWDEAETVPELYVKQSKIALMHSELSEQLEALRKGNGRSEHCPELSAEEEELADLFIRLMDYCGYYEIDLGEAVRVKMAFNLTRERKHGKAN